MRIVRLAADRPCAASGWRVLAMLSACVSKPSIDERVSTRVIPSQAPLSAVVFGETVEATNVDARRDHVPSRLAGRHDGERGTAVARAEAEAAADGRPVDGSRPGDRRSTAPEPPSAAARERIAVAFVRQWKINPARHERYSGRVANQQGGAEPLDPWRRLLEDRQARGEMRLTDPAQAAAFWESSQNDWRQDFDLSGSAAEAPALHTQPWEPPR